MGLRVPRNIKENSRSPDLRARERLARFFMGGGANNTPRVDRVKRKIEQQKPTGTNGKLLNVERGIKSKSKEERGRQMKEIVRSKEKIKDQEKPRESIKEKENQGIARRSQQGHKEEDVLRKGEKRGGESKRDEDG